MTPINQHILDETDWLFGCDYFADDSDPNSYDPDGTDERSKRADELLANYPWRDVFAAWKNYLFTKCKTPKSVINFCNLYFVYGGADRAIPDPYEFVGYIYYRVDLDVYWDDAGDFLDGLCARILENSGEISEMENPYYQSWTDPKTVAAVEKFQLRAPDSPGADAS